MGPDIVIVSPTEIRVDGVPYYRELDLSIGNLIQCTSDESSACYDGDIALVISDEYARVLHGNGASLNDEIALKDIRNECGRWEAATFEQLQDALRNA